MRELIMQNGANRWPTEIFEQSSYIDCRVLEENVAEAHTVPAGARFVRISVDHGTAIYVKFGDTAAVPSGDVTDGSASEVIAAGMSPVTYFIGTAATIGLISPEFARVTLAFYK